MYSGMASQSTTIDSASRAAEILCCQCGIAIEPNPSNTCIGCLRTQVDFTGEIPKQSSLSFCKGCERYLVPPNTWVLCPLESQELMRICLKRLRGLNKVHLIDAGFVWTEPHSKRIKVKLTIQQEVQESIIQQVVVVEYIVHHLMCDECHRREAQDFWRAVIQVRQKISHKRTFMYLEQMILKHNLHTSALRIKECHDGLDFFFANKQQARKLVDFISSSVPSKLKTSQELVSHDIHNNKFQYKHTYSMEIAPISKNDLVCLPAKLAQSLGNIGQIVICARVTSSLQLMDPSSLQVVDLPVNLYWKNPFYSLCEHRQYVQFFVLRIEKVDNSSRTAMGALADAWVVPISKLGQTDVQLHCRTHLGYILSDGDVAWGFDFSTANLNDPNIDLMKETDIPNVVLIKKSYGDKHKRHKMRNWKMKQLEKAGVTVNRADYEMDYVEFLENIEEDLHYRKNVNVYLDPSVVQTMQEGVALDVPQIGVEEMLQDLSIND